MNLHIRATKQNGDTEDYEASDFDAEEDGWHLVVQNEKVVLLKSEFKAAIVVSFEPFEL